MTTTAHCATCGTAATTAGGVPGPALRPRYFAGQSLTEAELNAAQEYQLAKNRLHNRYLHGAGVVCGLQVVCVADPGAVQVHPGYALDTCGNDLLLDAARTVPLLSMISACRDADDRACAQPWRPAPAAPAGPERWCLTMVYTEQPTRPRTLLTTGRKSCGCGGRAATGTCGCGRRPVNGSGGCGGCGGQSATGTCGCGTAPAYEKLPPGCEPTRIAESVRFEVCRAPDGPCQDAFCDPQATLAGQIVAAYEEYRRVLRAHLSPEHGQVLLSAAFFADTPFEPGFVHESCLRLHDAIVDLERRQPFPVTGDPAAVLDAVVLPAPSGDPDEYLRLARTVLQRLEAALVQSFADRVSGLLLPPCPPEPASDRVVLACVTVQAGKIVRICNACRATAGAFPAQSHRLSILPLAALARSVTEWLTCRPLVTTDGNPLADLLSTLDPTFRRGRWQAGGYPPFPQVADLVRRLCALLGGEQDADTLGMLRGWFERVSDDGPEH
ncbi:hypothetical protein GCM10010168_27180 [Actinoplanes ianthinogenes]|uniref:Uncharacterized protein n=1 Tax=Actinoplanes ianthinogenes TaxID=122358 RepID=A0ABN6C5K0_9ACTN|nr:hypothetical protein [Actinoplanes ianthinogenes]BCJ39858.1 hypothetical protein Aiant_05150 [Actinoplanes ianthinogenes]GGR08629.1 hypothetical protein GCM10010168_27180 [Actinoplanes ianthinogenes]